MTIYAVDDVVPLVIESLVADNYLKSGDLYLVKEGDICYVRSELFYHMRNILVCNDVGTVYYFVNDSVVWKDLFDTITEVITMDEYYNKRNVSIKKFKPRIKKNKPRKVMRV